jgi:hypothetical protein
MRTHSGLLAMFSDGAGKHASLPIRRTSTFGLNHTTSKDPKNMNKEPAARSSESPYVDDSWPLRLIREMRLESLRERAQREARDACYSKLSWGAELVPMIAKEATQFIEHVPGRLIVLPPVAGASTVQINLTTDVWVPREIGSEARAPEEPAALVYSLHESGQVAVTLSGHRSAVASDGSFDVGDPFILALYSNAQSLAGQAGRARIRQHIRALSRLSVATRAHAMPSAANARLFNRLQARSERFRHIFASGREARFHRLQLQTALSASLVVGLLVGPVVALLKDVAEQTKKQPPPEGVVYRVAEALTAVNVLIGCLALALLAMVFVVHASKVR